MATSAQQLSLTNTSDETEIPTFYNELFSIARHIPKHHLLDMNAQISKNENNKFYSKNLPNRNGEYLTDFRSRTVFHG